MVQATDSRIKALVDDCYKRGRRRGAEFASVEYHTANVRASSFYQQRMGYRLAAITAIKRL